MVTDSRSGWLLDKRNERVVTVVAHRFGSCQANRLHVSRGVAGARNNQLDAIGRGPAIIAISNPYGEEKDRDSQRLVDAASSGRVVAQIGL